MKQLLSLLPCVFSFLFNLVLNAQDTIYLANPSFEDIPRKGSQFSIPIRGWTDCGIINFRGESPPDIHPVKGNAWDVSKEACNGKTYLSLVTRYTNTYESVSQLLSTPIEAGKCYRISACLALSEQYNSPTPRSSNAYQAYNRNQPVTMTENFSNPVELLVWGGHEYCQRVQLFVHSGAISNHEWKYYSLEIAPEESFEYITIGAFFVFGYTEPYNGHILVDGLSPIVEIECK